MAGKLSVMFELEMPNARAEGEKIGQQIGQGIASAINKAMGGSGVSNFSGSFLKNNPGLAQLIGGTNVINPPGIARGPQGIQKLLNLVQTSNMDRLHASGFNWKQALLGLGVSPFSPWVGARGIAGAFGGGGGGHGGGVGGALFGGNFSRFEAVFLAIHAAGELLRKTFEELNDAVKRGSELFTKSAALRVSTSSLFQQQELGKALGITQRQAEDLIFRQQWGHARNSLQQFRGRESLTSLPQATKDTLEWTKQIGAQWQRIAGELFSVDVASKKLHSNWQLFWGEVAAQFGPSLRDLMGQISALPWADMGKAIGESAWALKGLTDALAVFTLGLNASMRLLKAELIAGGISLIPGMPAGAASKLGLTAAKEALREILKAASEFGKAPYSKGQPDAILSRQLPKMTNFEHMGFVIGSMRTTDYQRMIAENTSKMAAGIQTLISATMGSGGSGMLGASHALSSLP